MAHLVSSSTASGDAFSVVHDQTIMAVDGPSPDVAKTVASISVQSQLEAEIKLLRDDNARLKAKLGNLSSSFSSSSQGQSPQVGAFDLLASNYATEESLEWITKLRTDPSQRRIRLREWEDITWRKNNGWVGRDLCHNPDGKAVCVLDYFWNGQQLTGIVFFGPNAESHRGLCHGGAYTSVLDDVLGHIAFVSGEKPWLGATVQVNVSLLSPIPIGTTARVVASMHKAEGSASSVEKRKKKIHVDATIDSGDGTKVYARMEGLTIAGVRITANDTHKDDSIAGRVWENVEMEGESVRRDTGWRAM